VKILQAFSTQLAIFLAIAQFCDGARIKDLTNVRGARDNQLHGIGLVVGLAEPVMVLLSKPNVP